MIYQSPLFTRAEIDAARPIVSTIAGFPFAHCLSWRWSDFSNQPFVADYSELYAWQFEESWNGPFRRI